MNSSAITMQPDHAAATRGLTVFFTGLSGAGKTTTADALVARLRASDRRPITLLDGDVVRRQTPSLGYAQADRERNIRRIGEMAGEIARAGGIAVCAAIAPYDALRLDLRAALEPAGGYVLVHMATPLATCEGRDHKGLYARARAGELSHFTGISDPYELPTDADLRLDATHTTPDDAAAAVMALLRQRELIVAADAPAAAVAAGADAAVAAGADAAATSG